MGNRFCEVSYPWRAAQAKSMCVYLVGFKKFSGVFVSPSEKSEETTVFRSYIKIKKHSLDVPIDSDHSLSKSN